MLIVYGTAGITFAVLLYAVTLIGCRNPQPPGWVNDFLVGNVYVPLIGAFFVLGAGCFIKFLLSPGPDPVGVTEAALAVGVAALGFGLLKALRVKKHLAEYAASSAGGEVIHLKDVRPGQPPTEHPVTPPSGKRAA